MAVTLSQSGEWVSSPAETSRLLLVRSPEADSAPTPSWWIEERTERLEHLQQILIMAGDSLLERVEAAHDLVVSAGKLTQTNERANDKDAHLNGLLAVQDRGGHDRTMLGVSPRP